MTERRDEIATGLATVRERIEAACAAAGRSSEEITLIVVTKFFPASDVRLLADLGVEDVGENRHQEAVEKAAECADLHLRWHFVGELQSNKAAAVAAYADVVQSVDRAKLVGGSEPGRPGARARPRLPGPGEPGPARGERPVRCDPADVPALAERIQAAEGLRLRGVMGVAPLGGDPGEAFARLAEVAARSARRCPRRPGSPPG